MSVIKVIEVVGTSPKSWEEAANNAVAKAAETLRNIVGVDLVGQTAAVKDRRIVEYRANVKIAFLVEEIREA